MWSLGIRDLIFFEGVDHQKCWLNMIQSCKTAACRSCCLVVDMIYCSCDYHRIINMTWRHIEVRTISYLYIYIYHICIYIYISYVDTYHIIALNVSPIQIHPVGFFIPHQAALLGGLDPVTCVRSPPKGCSRSAEMRERWPGPVDAVRADGDGGKKHGDFIRSSWDFTDYIMKNRDFDGNFSNLTVTNMDFMGI
jgi:hypothetical protein